MTYEELQEHILSFARHIAPSPDSETAFEIARQKEWLDHNGAPTEEGKCLIEALMEQGGTRTAFRQLA